MRSISFLVASESRLASGKLRNKLILLPSVTKASWKARSISSVVPLTAAGSGIPQCAVIGCPGQIRQTSFAALSQIVKTKFIWGAPGLENSSQLLLRAFSVGRLAARSCLSASGLTVPVGMLPALYAVKLG